ncbi:RNA-binding KH domain-containing protein RCF3 isoform X1 [Amborella trichopoda]|uniref:K Homology domain-containing protein n=1 Tax=Amborella trichopoda TaxID=13333 RepID=U5D1I1_AMBTC|nr:RNA-binding KH domain-containing protein RCF3 isoform X1 [Amborella trichopoda]XP_011626373.1 RNA-binding KH domain-containing protein RCF3 isoform X1 [Amborella trichopoda]XP_020528033.1 RNA-binding KH domain-containing protein RCF3 isoform X1 [Amborella trichopoda]XP_020528034.1 RNA-binding KH domain-containing protein RCF3 isoform X1 [Amborella trichopoda]XP_020528035.1 RNA-binding KH domain-containing protein RCF3 isoform X1 [Amborella trichopoda]XP_020528036.1 RNA-binding KH domain-con|eukprot:XP_006852751.1 RNA-binding KH domain-containing protein RCF3 isoform X1 [Amborella trichopoda]
MSFPLTPSKRPYEWHNEPNGRDRWHNTVQNSHSKTPSDFTVFRVLCLASKSGSVIGKGGTIVNHIQQATGAKVRVEDTVPGCDERVVVITGSEKDREAGKEPGKEDEEGENVANDDNDVKSNDEDKDDKESDEPLDAQSQQAMSSAQKALLLVFERTVEGEHEIEQEDDTDSKSSPIVFRFLVPSVQVGCILGKGGNVIKQISAESGAQIRILHNDKLPACAWSSEEVVQITGGLDSVRKALQAVSQQLQENPPRDRDPFPPNKPSGPPPHLFGSNSHSDLLPPSNYHFSGQGGPYPPVRGDDGGYLSGAPPPIPKFYDGFNSSRMKSTPEILTFKLLCMNEKVGGVIGKGGSIIRALQNETGAEIKILDSVPDSEDRVIVISAPTHPDDRISAAQDAVLRVQSRIFKAAPDSKEKNLVCKVLVHSNQIGCLLGKGGAIIAEMRKSSRAHIRILAKDQIPKCASDNEEVVQVTGEFEAVQEALLQITSRLRQHLFRDRFQSIINHPHHPAFIEQVPPPVPPYMGRRPPSPPGMYSHMGPSIHKFDLPPNMDHPGFPHGIQKPGFPHSSERMPPPAPWAHQGIGGSGSGSGSGRETGLPDYDRGFTQRRPDGVGSQSAIITSTTVEVVVPRAVVPTIYGENGECLKKIRQISGANITITEPRHGAKETAVIISGTPEQTNAAQSLLQAFVLSGQGSP